jgi:hypothetical protein
VGRRPGTAPVHFRAAPQQASQRRRRADATLATMLLALMVTLCLLCWGPIPVACLWLGSRANYLSGSVNLGIVATFASAAAALYGDLSVMLRADRAWVLVRRAAGHDQRTGTLSRIFAITALIGIPLFSFWFLVIVGPNDPSL